MNFNIGLGNFDRKILLGAVAAVVVVALAWYMLLWKPTTARLHHAQAAAASAEVQQQLLRGQIGALQAEQRRLPSEESKLDALEASVPASVSLPSVIDQISGVAHSSGVSFQSETQTLANPPPSATAGGTTASTPTTKPAAGLQQLQFSFVVNGSYNQVMGFLEALGKLPRAAITQSIQVSTATSGLTATIQTVVFYDPTPTPKLPAIAGAQ